MAQLHQSAQPSKLDRSGSDTFDGAGRAEVSLGPVPPGQRWLVQRIIVAATGPTDPMPTCSVYDGAEGPGRLLDATWNGTQDVSDFGTPHVLDEQDELVFIWEGGTPGETATARLAGRIEPL